MNMRYLSVCSGIEAATVAWLPLGWSPVAFAENASFPSAVLAHHFPLVPNLGDITHFHRWPDADVDVLIGGTPCQSFSVAGLREGLADPRGNLALTYLAIAKRYLPFWLAWENVPGVLSLNGGTDFAAFLGGLGELRYGWAYRVLDAVHFGVPQRRRRVVVVGCLGGWAAAAAVLFESASLRRDPPPSRASREASAGTLTSSLARCSADEVERGGLVAGTLEAHHSVRGQDAWSDRLVVGAVSAKWRKGTGGPAGDECYNLVPFDTTQITHPENRSNPQPGDPSPRQHSQLQRTRPQSRSPPKTTGRMLATQRPRFAP
jgi:DNA (cytosine-5)-methyltransferase 1